MIRLLALILLLPGLARASEAIVAIQADPSALRLTGPGASWTLLC